MTFFRFCEKCGRRFNPDGKYQKTCQSCLHNIRHENFINLIELRKLKYRRI